MQPQSISSSVVVANFRRITSQYLSGHWSQLVATGFIFGLAPFFVRNRILKHVRHNVGRGLGSQQRVIEVLKEQRDFKVRWGIS